MSQSPAIPVRLEFQRVAKPTSSTSNPTFMMRGSRVISLDATVTEAAALAGVGGGERGPVMMTRGRVASAAADGSAKEGGAPPRALAASSARLPGPASKSILYDERGAVATWNALPLGDKKAALLKILSSVEDRAVAGQWMALCEHIFPAQPRDGSFAWMFFNQSDERDVRPVWNKVLKQMGTVSQGLPQVDGRYPSFRTAYLRAFTRLWATITPSQRWEWVNSLTDVELEVELRLWPSKYKDSFFGKLGDRPQDCSDTTWKILQEFKSERGRFAVGGGSTTSRRVRLKDVMTKATKILAKDLVEAVKRGGILKKDGDIVDLWKGLDSQEKSLKAWQVACRVKADNDQKGVDDQGRKEGQAAQYDAEVEKRWQRLVAHVLQEEVGVKGFIAYLQDNAVEGEVQFIWSLLSVPHWQGLHGQEARLKEWRTALQLQASGGAEWNDLKAAAVSNQGFLLTLGRHGSKGEIGFIWDEFRTSDKWGKLPIRTAFLRKCPGVWKLLSVDQQWAWIRSLSAAELETEIGEVKKPAEFFLNLQWKVREEKQIGVAALPPRERGFSRSVRASMRPGWERPSLDGAHVRVLVERCPIEVLPTLIASLTDGELSVELISGLQEGRLGVVVALWNQQAERAKRWFGQLEELAVESLFYLEDRAAKIHPLKRFLHTQGCAWLKPTVLIVFLQKHGNDLELDDIALWDREGFAAAAPYFASSLGRHRDLVEVVVAYLFGQGGSDSKLALLEQREVVEAKGAILARAREVAVETITSRRRPEGGGPMVIEVTGDQIKTELAEEKTAASLQRRVEEARVAAEARRAERVDRAEANLKTIFTFWPKNESGEALWQFVLGLGKGVTEEIPYSTGVVPFLVGMMDAKERAAAVGDESKDLLVRRIALLAPFGHAQLTRLADINALRIQLKVLQQSGAKTETIAVLLFELEEKQILSLGEVCLVVGALDKKRRLGLLEKSIWSGDQRNLIMLAPYVNPACVGPSRGGGFRALLFGALTEMSVATIQRKLAQEFTQLRGDELSSRVPKYLARPGWYGMDEAFLGMLTSHEDVIPLAPHGVRDFSKLRELCRLAIRAAGDPSKITDFQDFWDSEVQPWLNGRRLALLRVAPPDLLEALYSKESWAQFRDLQFPRQIMLNTGSGLAMVVFSSLCGHQAYHGGGEQRWVILEQAKPDMAAPTAPLLQDDPVLSMQFNPNALVECPDGAVVFEGGHPEIYTALDRLSKSESMIEHVWALREEIAKRGWPSIDGLLLQLCQEVYGVEIRDEFGKWIVAQVNRLHADRGLPQLAMPAASSPRSRTGSGPTSRGKSSSSDEAGSTGPKFSEGTGVNVLGSPGDGHTLRLKSAIARKEADGDGS